MRAPKSTWIDLRDKRDAKRKKFEPCQRCV
jgi:hypothetical protein